MKNTQPTTVERAHRVLNRIEAGRTIIVPRESDKAISLMRELASEANVRIHTAMVRRCICCGAPASKVQHD